ncbi:hypothetical protein [Mycobacterium saskatchewanense]|uniref:SnoaL-like domain-containing protein n=2 Tax=Mycobacterium saskatchewanense TaxID=220927 RepID=A0AAJ3TUJ8_9MYCO|nr:hypothetical protein [Mycobacterium saskatchewanense]ORW70767.1 hypothetical protein AWC23_16155 [Mycobacterium saskatchewanense]
MRELLFCKHRPVNEVMDDFFAEDYQHRDNGRAYSRDEFAGLAGIARTAVACGEVSTLEEFRFWNRYATRLMLELNPIDGPDEHVEVYAIGQYAVDGRFLRLSQARLSLPGAGRVVRAELRSPTVA